MSSTETAAWRVRPTARTAMVLWVLLGLFVLRVLGQVLVGVGIGGLLPSWEEWFSGLTWCSRRSCSSSACIIVARRGSMHQWVSENKITP